MITFDEGGGYYDSGYVQPIDFFGDGTRIPLIAVSPYSKGGHISHSYSDHVSFDKFVERNWSCRRSPAAAATTCPTRSACGQSLCAAQQPAIGDLMDQFDFDHDPGTRPCGHRPDAKRAWRILRRARAGALGGSALVGLAVPLLATAGEFMALPGLWKTTERLVGPTQQILR